MEKICPCCKEILIPKKVSAYYGRYIEVDQCPKCGGIWFDKWEMVSLVPKEVEVLKSINISYENCIPETCPVDGLALSLLKDPFLPKDIEIYYCPHCLGTFLKIEALEKYKKFQEEKRLGGKEERKNEKGEISKELEEKINKLLSMGEERYNEADNFEEKISNLVSVIIIILKILSSFLGR